MGDVTLADATPAEARWRYEQAHAIAAGIALPAEEARALEGIGRCQLREPDSSEAAAPLHRALSIYQRIGSRHAQRVAAILADHGI